MVWLSPSTGPRIFCNTLILAAIQPKHARLSGRFLGAANFSRPGISTRSHTPIMETRTLPVDFRKIGRFSAVAREDDMLDELRIELNTANEQEAKYLQQAAEKLRHSDVPIAFPTETVYGLGADATRSSAVKGIYKAKQRPSDNPLIVHFASLQQLRELLRPSQINGHASNGVEHDPIPKIYRPLISKFWPGPLTIILPNPSNSPLAPEVTAGLDTFGARMPRHALALALITLAGKPIAAPSANASTKPSPTAAEHVAYDLDGRIEIILDGGPCDVGVESTVVTGLSDPPRILRPGGISLEQLRSCPGWERTEIGYKNVAEADSRPSAPGMKYRHYSPKAAVVLYECEKAPPMMSDIRHALGPARKIGMITTKCWRVTKGNSNLRIESLKRPPSHTASVKNDQPTLSGFAGMLTMLENSPDARKALKVHDIAHEAASEGHEAASEGLTCQLLEVALGSEIADVARGIFSALRELDRSNVDTIFVEGIDESEGDTAAAIMNRLRKAAEVRVAD